MRASRGTALPETAIVLSMVLLLLFGTVQLAIVGFYQSMSDGAAFVAAHAQSLSGSTGGPQVAATVFPQVHRGDVTISNPTASTVEATVAKSTMGFLLVPGAASSVSVNGADIEPQISDVFATPAPYQFSVISNLTNWCQSCQHMSLTLSIKHWQSKVQRVLLALPNSGPRSLCPLQVLPMILRMIQKK